MFYYARVLKTIYLDPPPPDDPANTRLEAPIGFGLAAALALAVLAIAAFGIDPGLVLNGFQSAASRGVTSVETFDVVVVGAGPAGSVAAGFASAGGARTLLVDRRTELGEPVQCGEYVPSPEELATIFPFPDVIREAFEVPPETVLRETTTMACIAPGGRRFAFPLRGATVSRRAFDKALAARAEGAGAELRFPCGVSRVTDDAVEFVGGGKVAAKVVIGADGPLSTVARSVGFSVPREMYRMITATSTGEFPPEIDLYFGSVAPGGYAWMIPRAHDAN
ncbi:MAG: FAD-dependent monooxygenase, partial [Thermoplasmata archaeon]|nr:FAD-dependent monooxygenase [Thermoplasmata archaeon]